MATTPVLDISTVVEELTVRIDGVNYRLLAPNQLPIMTIARLQKHGPRTAELMQRAGAGVSDGTSDTSLTDAEDAELSSLLGLLARSVLEAPPDVLAKLTDVHRLNIALTFTRLRSLNQAAATGARKQLPSIGARSRRGSKGSSAGTRRRG